MWLTLLGRFWYVPVIALLMGATWFYRSEYTQAERNLEVFTQATAVVGHQAQVYNKRVENEWKTRMQTALSGRSAALARLRDTNAGFRGLSYSPAAATGDSPICIPTDTYNAAFQRYSERVNAGMARLAGYATEGDQAQIDAQGALESWPR